jgi:hypothetical protein
MGAQVERCSIVSALFVVSWMIEGTLQGTSLTQRSARAKRQNQRSPRCGIGPRPKLRPTTRKERRKSVVVWVRTEARGK